MDQIKTLSDGRVLSSDGTHFCLDGARIGTLAGAIKLPAARGDLTHALATSIGHIGLTLGEANHVNTMRRPAPGKGLSYRALLAREYQAEEDRRDPAGAADRRAVRGR